MLEPLLSVPSDEEVGDRQHDEVDECGRYDVQLESGPSRRESARKEFFGDLSKNDRWLAFGGGEGS